MQYCVYCGKPLEDNQPGCQYCGAANPNYVAPVYYQQNNAYAPAPQPGSVNGIAITGFVFAFLFPLVGLILSAIALGRANKGGMEKPLHGLAVAGLVLSIIGLVVGIILLCVFGTAACASILSNM